MVDGKATELEQTYKKVYNNAIIAATAKMRKIKDIIYQLGFELGLERAQILYNHELNRLKVSCPNIVFHATVETKYGTEVVAFTGANDGSQEQQYADLIAFFVYFCFFFLSAFLMGPGVMTLSDQ